MESKLVAVLNGHNGWVTSLDIKDSTLVSGSRDKTLLVWKKVEESYVPYRLLTGHSHFIQDLCMSQDGKYALTASWDGTVRLWNLDKFVSQATFVDHKKDILSVAFSADNRQIATGSRDHSVKIWNTIGECKFTMDQSQDWVSCVRFSSGQTPYIIASSWDKKIRVYNASDCGLKFTLTGHENIVNTLDISPDGSLCASGSKDGIIKLWDLTDGHQTDELNAGCPVNALAFCPKNYWIAAATSKGIKIWDLEQNAVVFDLNRSDADFAIQPLHPNPEALTLRFNETGDLLFAGYTDSCIRVYKFSAQA